MKIRRERERGKKRQMEEGEKERNSGRIMKGEKVKKSLTAKSKGKR